MLLTTPIELDLQGLLSNLRREGTPKRVFNIEVRIDDEVLDALTERFELDAGLRREDPFYRLQRDIKVYRFLGLEMFRCLIPDFLLPHPGVDEKEWWAGRAPLIRSWEDFERYPWPDPGKADLSSYEWLDHNLPPDMSAFMPHAQLLFLNLTFLLGFEQLCLLIYDQPDLVHATIERIGRFHCKQTEILCQFDCVKAVFGADDWGFKTGTLMSPQWMIEHILPWVKKMVSVVHRSGRLYLMHCCGDIEALMPALLDDVQIDAHHSYQDQILPVTEAKRKYGDRIAVLGGIDVDVLCRSDEASLRRYVRKALDVCMPGGGYCLGTGNSVANYVPLDNYLIMLDEGRRYGASR